MTSSLRTGAEILSTYVQSGAQRAQRTARIALYRLER